MSAKKTKLTVRILAWILAIMMVLGIAVLTVQMFIESAEQKKKAEEDALKEQQKQEQENEEDEHEHDHDHDH